MTEELDFDPDRALAVYAEDACYFRASGVAGCSRAMAAALMGMDEAGLWESANVAAAAGHAIEPHALDLLEEIGWEIKHRQVPCREEIAPGMVIEGRADAVATHIEFPAPRLIEVKSLGVTGFEAFVRDPVISEPWAWQITLYMKMLKLDRALLAVVSREAEPRLEIIGIDAPPADINQIIEHLYMVIAWAEEGDLPPCDKVNPFCRFWYLHEEEEIPESEDAELDWHALRYKALGKAIGNLEAIRNGEKVALGELLGERDTVRTSSVLVRWVTQQRTRTDTKAMAEMLLELGGNPDEFQEAYEVRYVGTWLAGKGRK